MKKRKGYKKERNDKLLKMLRKSRKSAGGPVLRKSIFHKECCTDMDVIQPLRLGMGWRAFSLP